MKKLDLFKMGVIFTIIGLTFSSCDKEENEQIIISDGLVAYLPFNGNANDESLNGNDGSVNGATLATDRNNQMDFAYYFDGSSNIQIANSSTFNDMDLFSICVWVCPTELKYRDNTIISKVNPNRDFNLKILKTNMKYEAHFAYGATYYRCFSEDEVELNKWTHIVYQWTGLKWLLHINGVFVTEVEFSGIVPPWTGAIMAIGSMNNTEFFTGKIDNIRIYNRILSENEIDLIYNDTE